MITLDEVRRTAARRGVGLETVEHDYVLSWVLRGIFENDILAPALVFKGGSALRKAYFPQYRYSQDLDFTVRQALTEEGIAGTLSQALFLAGRESGLDLSLVELRRTRDEEGEEAYLGKVEYIGPRQQRRGSLPRIRLDITCYERIILDLNLRPLHHPYSDPCQVLIPTYRLEEIAAEKLRALLRRSRARDLYDVWYLLKFQAGRLDLPAVKDVFLAKCEHKDVAFGDGADFFKPAKLETHRRAWEASLRRQLADVPSYRQVEEEIKPLIEELLASA